MKHGQRGTMEGVQTGHNTREGSGVSRAGQRSQELHGKLREFELFHRRDGKDKAF